MRCSGPSELAHSSWVGITRRAGSRTPSAGPVGTLLTAVLTGPGGASTGPCIPKPPERGIMLIVSGVREDGDMTIRGDMLDEAKSLIDGDRNNQYGPPTQDFQRTANVLSELGFRHVDPSGNPSPLSSHHTALIMMALKLSRISWQPEKRDSWVDAAGYAGCGWECVTAEAKPLPSLDDPRFDKLKAPMKEQWFRKVPDMTPNLSTLELRNP